MVRFLFLSSPLSLRRVKLSVLMFILVLTSFLLIGGRLSALQCTTADLSLDLIYLPAVAFSPSPTSPKLIDRLGHGKGYYDTFLETYEGLCRERGWKTPTLGALRLPLLPLSFSSSNGIADSAASGLCRFWYVLPVYSRTGVEGTVVGQGCRPYERARLPPRTRPRRLPFR